MSALPLKADMLSVGMNVCFVPIADCTTTAGGYDFRKDSQMRRSLATAS